MSDWKEWEDAFEEPEDPFKELDEYAREMEALHGTPIHSTDGDVRGLKRVTPGTYWKKPGQIVTPVAEEKVQEYLQNKDNQPVNFARKAWMVFAICFAAWLSVHLLSSMVRSIGEHFADHRTNTVATQAESSQEAADGTWQIGEQEKTQTNETQTNEAWVDETQGKEAEYERGVTYYTEDGLYAFVIDGIYDETEGEYRDGIKITEYLGDDTTATVPEDINGEPVKEVRIDLFSGNNKIETVDVQAQITSIRFRDCTALREVTLPVTINEIETRSFYNTPALERVTVDKACVIDGDWSYSTVPEIHYVELSEGVGDSTQVEMKAEHNYYTADGRFQFQYTDQGLIIKKYIGTDSEVTVPEKIQGYPVTDIVREAFSGNNMIEKVTINAKLQDIGDVFRDNEVLREVVVPPSVKSIGYLAFYNTPALSTLTVASDCVVSSQCAGYDVNLTINYTE